MIIKLAEPTLPFTYPDNVPPSLKYFKPSIQRKAVFFTNEYMKDNPDVGFAIARATKKAKAHHDSVLEAKGLRKIASNVHSFGCVMIVPESSKQIQDMLDLIKDSEVYTDPKDDSYGKQKPHVTSLYGIRQQDASKKVSDLVRNTTFGNITLLKASCFYADKYDVVKLEVKLDGCVEEFHSKLEKAFSGYENTHGSYKPHLTLAYVEKGLGDKICKRFNFKPFSLKIVKVDYSLQNGQHRFYTVGK